MMGCSSASYVAGESKGKRPGSNGYYQRLCYNRCGSDVMGTGPSMQARKLYSE